VNLMDKDGAPLMGVVHSANERVAVVHLDDGRTIVVSVSLLCQPEERET
jgi:hypothetical protein